MITSDMTPLSLFMQAGLVGKGVICVLLLMSIWCWVLIVETWWGARKLRMAVDAAGRGAGDSSALEQVLAAGEREARAAFPGETASEARARVGDAMHRAASGILATAERGLPNLAIIASAAPFIGLFGTVWGIMNSFTGIAAAQDTSLAVVAPGIAEALAATAIGLAAAIPASVGYTRLGASFGRLAQDFGHAIDERAVTLAHRSRRQSVAASAHAAEA
jgi:biopolymer transport protein ExbB/TolQ